MKVGDRVSVIEEDLRGTVTKISKGNVEFSDAHGFVHTRSTSEVVLYSPELYHEVVPKNKETPQKPKSKKHQKNPLVLDLHIDKLSSTPEKLSPQERLWLQKDQLRKTLEFCKTHRLKRLEIIHGVGEGILQQLVIDLLESSVGLSYHHTAILKEQSGSVLVEFT